MYVIVECLLTGTQSDDTRVEISAGPYHQPQLEHKDFVNCGLEGL